ncbi:hypothetical protein ACFSY7_08335 [Kurthia populi]|uniref:Uncharacterized protein n=1 Tax=Kurthia populi TaxID=1562132 RepID=A0ABW5Y0E2_9BACL
MKINWFNFIASALFLYMGVQILNGVKYDIYAQAFTYFSVAVALLNYSFLFEEES